MVPPRARFNASTDSEFLSQNVLRDGAATTSGEGSQSPDSARAPQKAPLGEWEKLSGHDLELWEGDVDEESALEDEDVPAEQFQRYGDFESMSERPEFDGAIFDLDGTLIDSLADIADCMNQVLRELGRPEHPYEVYKRMVGDGVTQLVMRALRTPESGAEDKDPLLDQAVTRYRQLYHDAVANKTSVYAGIHDLLRYLEEVGVRIAVLTNKPQQASESVVNALLKDHPFSPVIGQTAERPIKPDPTSAFAIAESWQMPPERILYFGDTDTDMITANRASMLAVGCAWGFRDEDELRRFGAHWVFQNPEDVLRWLADPEL